MAKADRYISGDIVYLSKKHYCPECGAELKTVKVSKEIDPDSNEAKEMPKMFSKTIVGSRGVKFRRYNYAGDTTYVWKEFECEKCSRHLTVDEMKEIEEVSDGEEIEQSPEEIKRIKRKNLIYNIILPIAILALAAIIKFFVKE